MQKQNMIVVLLLVMALFVGGVMAADSGTTILTGPVEGCNIGIVVPVDTSITLARANDNIQGIGNVQVINNCDTPWTVNVVADSANMYDESATTYRYLTTVMGISTDKTTWKPFSPAAKIITALTGTDAIELDKGSGAKTFPIYIKQTVTGADFGGNYKIKFTFNLIQG